MFQHALATLAMVTIAAPAVAAQGRQLDLTGPPAHRSSEPFSTLAGIAEVAPGKVVVSDIREKRLVLVDVRGGIVTDIGRQGGGPGEWQLPMRAFPGREGQVYVPDMMQGKIHVVSSEGEIVESVSLSGDPGAGTGMMPMVMPEAIDSRGRIYYNSMSFSPDGESAEMSPVVRRDFTDPGSAIDTVAWIQNPFAMRITTSASGGNDFARVSGRSPYQARDEWVALPNGTVAVIGNDPYRMTIHSKGNPPVSGPTVDYTPVRIGAAERDAYREAQKSSTGVMISAGSGGVSSNTISMGDREIPDEEFPEVMPPFARGAVTVAPNGDVWVRRNRAAGDDTPVYDVFSVGGQLVGQARLRPNSRVVAFGRESIYVRWQDPETDLVYLQEYR